MEIYAFVVVGLIFCMISTSQCVSALIEAENEGYLYRRQWDSYDCHIDL